MGDSNSLLGADGGSPDFRSAGGTARRRDRPEADFLRLHPHPLRLQHRRWILHLMDHVRRHSFYNRARVRGLPDRVLHLLCGIYAHQIPADSNRRS